MKLANMNLHKDFGYWLGALVLTTVMALVHRGPAALVLLQVEWATEAARLIHALTEPTAVGTVLFTGGAVIRYLIWTRKRQREHQIELEAKDREIEKLQRQLNGTETRQE